MAVLPEQSVEAGRLWEQVLVGVRGRLGSHQAFDTWFKPIIPLEITPEAVELEVPNAFFVDWIHEHHLASLSACLAEVLGAAPTIRFAPREAPAPVAPSNRAGDGIVGTAQPPRRDADAAQPARAWLDSQLNPRLTFESFVVGGGNRFTQAACLAVATNPANVYNPLFIFGGSGLGKTHLLHAIGHAVRQRRPESRVYYVSSERFMNEMIYAIQHGQTLAFRNKYRNVDTLLIDDIQFLAGKESTQEEFFYTFNALRDAHKQVVVTADKPPKDIPMLEARLTSRFNQGLVTDIKQPDIETRIAILRNRCEQDGDGLRLPDDVLLMIADRIRGNVRDLEGCLVRLMAVGSLTRQELTLELAEEVLQNYVNPEPDQMTPERIVTTVSERFGIKAEALFGAHRTRSVALPRQVAMYLMRQLTELSLVEIGRLFGGRDHTTVLYACKKIGTLLASDEQFSEKINSLISTLASG
ncbi:MAG: chromosomal replication initiator protein DnaA [Candidatus Eisenbacteria bacterium]|nr:chromosomal replication initiator protein DnaA [Candidatus Eisenbacteria bacterium]